MILLYPTTARYISLYVYINLCDTTLVLFSSRYSCPPATATVSRKSRHRYNKICLYICADASVPLPYLLLFQRHFSRYILITGNVTAISSHTHTDISYYYRSDDVLIRIAIILSRTMTQLNYYIFVAGACVINVGKSSTRHSLLLVNRGVQNVPIYNIIIV